MPRDRLDEVRRLWVPAQVGAVLFREDPPVDYRPYRGHDRRTRLLRDAWLDMITSHPIEYLVERADLYRRLLALGDTPPSTWYRESDQIRAISPGLRQRLTGLNDLRAEYLELFESGEPGRGGPLHRPWIYVLLGLGGSIALIVMSSRLRVFGWTLLALQVSLQVVVAFAAPLLEYRFQLFQVVLGIISPILAAPALAAWILHRGRRSVERSFAQDLHDDPAHGEHDDGGTKPAMAGVLLDTEGHEHDQGRHEHEGQTTLVEAHGPLEQEHRDRDDQRGDR